MATLSVDLRERILAVYDRGEETRDQVARRFGVSVGMVKKLLQQRRHTGDIAPRHHRSGRKPRIMAKQRIKIRKLLGENPAMTLEELRAALKLDCTLQAIHYVLEDMGLTSRKRRSTRANKMAKTSPEHSERGSASKAASSRRSSSSSTNQRQ